MKNKVLAIILSISFLTLPLYSCEKSKSTEQAQNSTSSVIMEEGTFDIEGVRNSINIKGYRFTVPQKLSELENGLKYKFIDEEYGDGLYVVEISDKNGVVLEAVAENAHKKSKKALLYNISARDSNSDVAGIVPFTSTKEDVLAKFGEPYDKKTVFIKDEENEFYYYGLIESEDLYTVKGKYMTITFNSLDIVEKITVNYSE